MFCGVSLFVVFVVCLFSDAFTRELSLKQINTKYDPKIWKPYLDTNKMKQCAARPDQPPMPLSFYAPPAYFDSVPLNERVPPSRAYVGPQMVPACNHQMVDPALLNAYEFETERYLSAIGLNIYDGAIHSMASALLGEADDVINYENSILLEAKTCQFGDIRGDAPCKGVINSGECTDKDQSGACGFCYGTGSNQDRSVSKQNAWTFRMISDYYALQGTVDARCPTLGIMWTWNDYRPVLGENAWAFLTGPLQVSYIKYGSFSNIPDDDISLTMGIQFLGGLPKMVTSVGGVAYSPKNTIAFNSTDSGFDVSTENNVSLMAGLKMLRYTLTQKNLHKDQIPIIDSIMTSVESFIKAAYDPNLGYFRQGGTFDNVTGTFAWHTGPSGFAVDCQTWTISVLGPTKIDSWFGAGTVENIWAIAKKLGGYNYLSFDQSVEGMGFSVNNNDEVFSGEWSFGTINMLRVIAQATGNTSYIDEANSMRDNINQQLAESATINGVSTYGVLYANKRYWIPFGWWANPLISTASTGWAVLVDSNYNPFYLGGKYLTDY